MHGCQFAVQVCKKERERVRKEKKRVFEKTNEDSKFEIKIKAPN